MSLDEVRRLARKRPEQEFVLNRLYGAHISPFFTVASIKLGLSPDLVTIVGGAFGALGVALLFVPIGWWSLVAVACLQIGYILDFSDGQVARLTGRTSVAGSYLDWLTHFYVPVAMAFAAAASVAWATDNILFIIAGTLAALELAAFVFSCKEHVLIAMQRNDPGIASGPGFRAALNDDAHPADVAAAPGGVTRPAGISGRAHAPSLRSTIGELLIYPGSVHLMTVAVAVDVGFAAAGFAAPVVGRGALLVLWAVVFPMHLFLTGRRNHRVFTAIETRSRAELGGRDV